MFANPVKILKMFGLRENMILADLGAGSGFYTIPAAKMLNHGRVYAIDVQKDFLTTIKNFAREENIQNIEYIFGDVEKIGGTKIEDNVIDAVLVSNIFFQIKDKESFINEIKRILKKDCEVLLIDWSDNLINFGLKNEQIVSKENAKKMFENNGFVWVRDIDAGSHHYGIILKKI